MMQTKSKPKKKMGAYYAIKKAKGMEKALKDAEFRIKELEAQLEGTEEKLVAVQREGRRLAEEAYAGMQLKRALLDFLPR